MADFKDKVVLVTGGASGIGFLMGKRSLKEGAAHLIIWDINEDQLLLAADTLSKEGFSVSTQLVDISDADSVVEAATRVLSDFEGIDFLFNNAGVVVGKPFHTQNSNDIARTMRINAEGMMYVTNAFLPAMIQAKSGHIINITSAAGLLPHSGSLHLPQSVQRERSGETCPCDQEPASEAGSAATHCRSNQCRRRHRAQRTRRKFHVEEMRRRFRRR